MTTGERGGAGVVEATPNPTDAAIERHIWPDGDWHHETCRCGVPWPCDAGTLARAASTALEELDSCRERANAAFARLEAARGGAGAVIDTTRVCNCGGGEFVFYGEMIQPAEPDVGIMGDIYQFTLSVEDSCSGCVHELTKKEIDKLENDAADDYALDR